MLKKGPDIRIRRDHDLGIDDAKTRLNGFADDLGSKFALTSRWHGDELAFQGHGVNGRIAVAADSVEVHVWLGLALMMMKGPIRSAIEGVLDDELG